MTEIYAKPIVDGKFWIVEKDGYVMSDYGDSIKVPIK